MKLLWDTHTFIWLILGDEKLSEQAKIEIENPENDHYLSIASLWEIGIKVKLGKLEILQPFENIINDVTKNGINILPINFNHLVENMSLELHHRDPFDRLIISQSKAENMFIISKDEIFDKYINNRIW
jgi:PIN domain nuclease of toxin-antitoxin system